MFDVMYESAAAEQQEELKVCIDFHIGVVINGVEVCGDGTSVGIVVGEATAA